MPTYNPTPCAYCETIFTPRTYNNRHCSEFCKDKEWRIGRKAKWQANRDLGLCACGRKIVGGEWEKEYKTCAKCRSGYKKKPKKVGVEGICFKCGNLAERRWCADCHAQRQQRRRELDYQVRIRVLEAYGNVCECCGEAHPNFLSIDHIYGRADDHPAKLSGGAMTRWIARQGFPKDKYRLLCHNCNHGRYINGGTCPHEEERLKLVA